MIIADLVTLIGLVVAFVVFFAMALREIGRSGTSAVRNLKFQLAIATFVWLLGESLTFIDSVLYGLYNEFLEIHTISMGIFALIILTRLPGLVRRRH